MGVGLFSQISKDQKKRKQPGADPGNEPPGEVVVVAPSLEVDVDVALGVTV